MTTDLLLSRVIITREATLKHVQEQVIKISMKMSLHSKEEKTINLQKLGSISPIGLVLLLSSLSSLFIVSSMQLMRVVLILN